MAEMHKQIKITADTHQAETAIARLELEMKEFGERIERFQGMFSGVRTAAGELGEKLERLGIASLFAEGGAIGLANKIADVGYELGEASIKTGLTTQQLQFWQYVAKQSGIESETLTRAFARLTMNIGMANKPTSEQAQAFRFLGISSKYLHDNANNTNELFVKIMTQLGKVHDQTKRNLASQILLSRSYIDLLPVMKAVSQGNKENIEDFEKYGYVLSEEAIKQSEEFHRASINLQTSLGGLADVVGVTLIPIIQPLIKSTADYVAQNRNLIAQKVSSYILQISNGFYGAYQTAKPFLQVMGELIDKAGGFKTVILAIGGYLAADLAVSFVQLGIQIGLATVAIGRFIAADILANFKMLLNIVKALGKAFGLLDVLTALNPIVLAATGIAAAIGLVATALYKLVGIIKQIKQTFNANELMREIGVVGNKVAGLFAGNINPAVNQMQGGGFLQAANMPIMQPAAIVPRNNPAITNNQKNQLNVHLKIDSEGRPTIENVQSSQPISFTSALGILR